MIDAIKIMWSIFKTVRQFLKDLKTKEEQALSDDNAIKMRLKLEAWAMKLQEGQDKGWRKWLQVDNPARLLRFARIALKSQKLADIECGTVVQAESSREALKNA